MCFYPIYVPYISTVARCACSRSECTWQTTSKVVPQKCLSASVPGLIDAMSESNSPKTDASSSSLLRQFRFQKKQAKAINMCKNSRIFFCYFMIRITGLFVLCFFNDLANDAIQYLCDTYIVFETFINILMSLISI